jgi:cellobiose-specific phosphotransferase system component IIB
MPSTIYDIQLRYRMDDQASKGLDGIAGGASRANASAGMLSGTLLRLAGVAAAGFGMQSAGKALVGFNADVQDVKLQIAGMLSLTRQTDLVDEIGKADQLFANLQKRANTLPGTTAEYAHFAGMVTRGIAEAGLSMKDLENLTVNAVVAAKSLGENADVAARDIDQALRGMYRSVDPFSSKVLGSIGYGGEEGRKKYNSLSAEERASELKRGLMQKQWAQLATAKGKTFSGVLSTVQDSLQQTLGKVGLPLFEAIGAELIRWNTWAAANGDTITAWAKEAGGYLRDGFAFVKDAISFLIEHKDEIISIGKVWLAVKVAGGAGSMLSGLGGGLGALKAPVGLTSMKGISGLLGGLGAVAGAGMVGWQLGRQLDEATGIGKIVMEPVARMVGVWDDAAAKHQAEMDRLSKSIERMDVAIGEAAARASGKTNAAGTQSAANLQGMVDIKREDELSRAKLAATQTLLEQQKKSMPWGTSSGIDTAIAAAVGVRAIMAPLDMSQSSFASAQRLNVATTSTDSLLAQAMASLTEEQRKNVDVEKTSQAIMEKMTYALSGIVQPHFEHAQQRVLQPAAERSSPLAPALGRRGRRDREPGQRAGPAQQGEGEKGQQGECHDSADRGEDRRSGPVCLRHGRRAS